MVRQLLRQTLARFRPAGGPGRRGSYPAILHPSTADFAPASPSLRRWGLLAVFLGATLACSADPGTGDSVRPGIDVLLSDSLHLIAGRRLGLITHDAGRGRDGRRSVDLLLQAGAGELLALFSPEHGFTGTAPGGEAVADGIDASSELSIYSLYGETPKPTPGMLRGLDALLFDLQDVGARYYTYVSTLAMAMEAAAESGIPFIVLDRPNPIGGQRVQGNVLEPAYASFVGLYPVPMRHGMTAGELARFYNQRQGIGAELHVVPAAGWHRDMWFDQTGLKWIPPSPNLPTLESVAHYPGTCLFEGTNLSVGRGTDRAFQQIGAPWLDGRALANRLSSLGLPGVRFEEISFTPRDPGDGKYGGETVRGVRWVVTDRTAYNPTLAGVAALLEARRLAGPRWEWRDRHFDRLAGNGRLRRQIEAGLPLEEIVEEWPKAVARFQELRAPYLIYP